MRRLFEVVGSEVERLVRVRIGSLTLAGLREGEWRRLRRSEVDGAVGIAAAVTRTVAIDGPSGAGKSTIGHALAKRIDATFVDTGLMYRALTLAALERGIDVDDGPALGALATECRIEVERPRPEQTDRLETVRLDGRDVTLEVRTPPIDRAVSAVSRHAEVRDAMLGVQRAAAERGDTVMVGRDIGTVVAARRDAEGLPHRPRRRARRAARDRDGASGSVPRLPRRDRAPRCRRLGPRGGAAAPGRRGARARHRAS